jgi:hypothetical protein
LHHAVSYIAGNPVATALNAAKKIGRLFESEGALLVMTFHDAPEDVSIRYGTKYASLPLFWILLTDFSYFIMVLAALFGFLSAERDRLWWIALATLLSWLVIHAVFFGGGRFHFPLMPLMAAYAAQFLSEPRKRHDSLTRLKKSLAYCTLIVLCALWLIEAYVIFHD